MVSVMVDRDDRIYELQDRMAVACGVANATAAELVALVAEALEGGLWDQGGVMSPEHWAGWQAGLAPVRARQVVAAARRSGELPVTFGLFGRGLLSLDQVAAIVRYCPANKDAEVAEFAVAATVSQLRRVLSRYGFDAEAKPPKEEETKKCSFGESERDSWRLNAEGPRDQGARIEATLTAIHDELVQAAGTPEEKMAVTYWDALVEMTDRASGAGSQGKRRFKDRHRVLMHVDLDDTGGFVGHLHLGSPLGDWARRYLGCDADVTPILERLGLPIGFGTTTRTVPDKLRIVVEDRDGGCRVPGCTATRWLHVHHIIHWEDQGPTVTWNLICVCAHHHRQHHRGLLGISGNADKPGGMIFTDARGRVIASSGSPAPPGDAPAEAAAKAGVTWVPYVHGSGERFDHRHVWFGEPPPSPN